MFFTDYLLAVDNTHPSIDVFATKGEHPYSFEEISYEVQYEIINEKLFWLYARYGKAKPYSEDVFNTKTKEVQPNKRGEDDAELRNQLFCLYIPEEQTIFISDSKKKKFLIKYLNDSFKKTFTLKKYFVSPEEFVEEISSLKKISFVGRDKNLFNGDVFKGVEDIFGYGEAVSFAISINIHDSKFDPKKCLDFLCFWKNKKEKIDKMICVGESDDGVEKFF